MTKPNTNPILWAAKFRIKYRGIFHMKLLYKTVHEWLKDKEWKDVDEGGLDHHERLYLDRTTPHGQKEYWIWWRMFYLPVNNSFYRWRMNIDYHCVYIQDIEVMHEGQKVKCNKGEVEMKILSYIEMDYEGTWSNHPTLKFLKDIFTDRIFQTEMDRHRRECYRETFILQGEIKKYLKLIGFLPQLEIQRFHPARTYK